MKTQTEQKGTKTMLVIAVVLLAMNAFSVSAENKNLLNYLSDTSNQSYVIADATNSRNFDNGKMDENSNSFIAEKASDVEAAFVSNKSGLYYEAIEKEIVLEDWMLSSEHNFWVETYEDIEDEIALEGWMLDPSKW